VKTSRSKTAARNTRYTNGKRKGEAPMGRIHYFDIDGNYGNANQITVVGTENWLHEDFLLVREAKDEERYLVARLVSDWITEGRDTKKYKKEFKKYKITPHKVLPPTQELPAQLKEIDMN
jgi:hypothetical protein